MKCGDDYWFEMLNVLVKTFGMICFVLIVIGVFLKLSGYL
nr:MAG TPA: hypothetical protein [Bacteriophage sp.]